MAVPVQNKCCFRLPKGRSMCCFQFITGFRFFPPGFPIYPEK